MADRAEDRERVLGLLRSQHTFPGEYQFRVVVRPPDRDAIVAAVAEVVGEAQVVRVTERASQRGAYVAVRVRVRVPDAERVVAVYDALRDIEGVFAVM